MLRKDTEFKYLQNYLESPCKPWRGSAAWGSGGQCRLPRELPLSAEQPVCACVGCVGYRGCACCLLGGAFTGIQCPAPQPPHSSSNVATVAVSCRPLVPLPMFREGAGQRRGALPSVFSTGQELGATSASGAFQAEPFPWSLSQLGHPWRADHSPRHSGLPSRGEGWFSPVCRASLPGLMHPSAHGNMHPQGFSPVQQEPVQGLHPAELATCAPETCWSVCAWRCPLPWLLPSSWPRGRAHASVRSVTGESEAALLAPALGPVSQASDPSQGQGPELSISLQRGRSVLPGHLS